MGSQKKIIGLVLGLVLVLGAAFVYYTYSKHMAPSTPPDNSVGAPTVSAPNPNPNPAESPAAVTPPTTGGNQNMMVINTDYGPVEIEFFPDDAPKTVARIKELVTQGFYDGLTFHRVVPNFVVQGGDPRGDGTGGSGKNLPAEFNNKQHVEGSVAMARANDPNSADSQFYIALGRIPYLDHNYTVFGQVTKGMDAVKKIKVGDKMTKVTLK